MHSTSMRIVIAVLCAMPTLLSGTVVKAAENLPNWRPANICAADSARGQCLLFERRAQNDIAASWDILPEAVRKSCLTRFTPPLEPSWRILGDCIEIEGRRAQQIRIDAQAKRERDALAALTSRTNEPGTDNKRAVSEEKTETRQPRQTQQTAGERDRIEEEKASFLALLAEQRRADAEAAKSKAAAKAAAAAKAKAEAARTAATDRKRVADEEASFMALLANDRRAEKAAKQRKAAADKDAADTKRKQLAAADAARIANEKASFEALLAEQRRADTLAAKRAAEARKAARAQAEAKERQRVEDEKASFLALLAAQRAADAKAKKAADAKKADAHLQAARRCEASLKKVRTASVIQFAFNSAELADKSGTETLDRLAEAVNSCEGRPSIIVEGHTDSQGAAATNLALSRARAEAVAKYLGSKGITADRISSRGFGEANPIATNATREGRAKNRRIEFKVK